MKSKRLPGGAPKSENMGDGCVPESNLAGSDKDGMDRKGGAGMARHGKKAAEKVEQAMHERKRGTLKSGRSGKRARSREQAVAIGLAQARREGAQVPPRESSSKRK
jgi:hypothetical protein